MYNSKLKYLILKFLFVLHLLLICIEKSWSIYAHFPICISSKLLFPQRISTIIEIMVLHFLVSILGDEIWDWNFLFFVLFVDGIGFLIQAGRMLVYHFHQILFWNLLFFGLILLKKRLKLGRFAVVFSLQFLVFRFLFFNIFINFFGFIC